MALTRDFKTKFECTMTMNDFFIAGGPDDMARKLGKPHVSGICPREIDIRKYELVIADK